MSQNRSIAADAPLVNLHSEIIGVSWAINGNNFVGIGYAVPINAFKQRLQKQIPAK